jgi:hypothetical protein
MIGYVEVSVEYLLIGKAADLRIALVLPPCP